MAGALALASALYDVIGVTRGINVYDEGLAVVGATRVLAGEIPYRDLWTLYGPGQYACVTSCCWTAAVALRTARRLGPSPLTAPGVHV